MHDFNKLNEYYGFDNHLDEASLKVLLSKAVEKQFEPLYKLVSEGDTKPEIFLIIKGLVRFYKINDKGDEVTTMLQSENQFFAAPDIILFQKPSSVYIETLESTTVLCMNYIELQEIIFQNKNLERNRNFVLRLIIKQLLKVLDNFVLLSPEERYLDFLKNNVDLINRVPDKYIANVLGITPVSLSRIRKRISQKRKK